MKQITIAALIMMMATTALAFLDPTPDTIGIYLEPEAETMCVEGLVDGGTDFTFYMIITNPSFDTMEGYMAGYHFEGNAVVNDAALAHSDAMDYGSVGEHLVNFSSPVPVSENTLLMTLSATYIEFEYGSAILELHNLPLAEKSIYAPGVIIGGGEYMDLNLTFDDGSTIRINADCGQVATESLSMDGIKSLYR